MKFSRRRRELLPPTRVFSYQNRVERHRDENRELRQRAVISTSPGGVERKEKKQADFLCRHSVKPVLQYSYQTK